MIMLNLIQIKCFLSIAYFVYNPQSICIKVKKLLAIFGKL